METYSQVIIPIATFLLGIAVTLVIRRLDQRGAMRRAYAKELADAAAAWHQRVYELKVAAETSNDDEFMRALLAYDQNRLELPRVIRSLAGLDGDTETKELAELGKEFLDIYTQLRTENTWECRFCVMPRTYAKTATKNARRVCDECGSLLIHNNSHSVMNGTDVSEILNRSDPVVQRISQKAGQLCA